MTRFFSFSSRPVKLVVLCSFAIFSATALADVKIVSRMISTSSMGGAQMPQTVTTYYHQGLMRSDFGNESTIINGKTHTTLLINHATKTYSQLSFTGSPQASMMKNMKMSVKGSIKPTTQKKTIAGKPARKYVGDFVITMAIPQMGGQRQTMKMHMEQWATTSIAAALSPSQIMGAMGNMLQGIGGAGSFSSMAKELGKIKGLPLDNKMSMTMVLAMPPGQQRPPGMPSTMSFGFENHVISVKETSLSPSLFKVPAGYKKSTAPTFPKPGP